MIPRIATNRIQTALALSAIMAAGLYLRLAANVHHTVMSPDYDGYRYISIARNMLDGGLGPDAVNWTPLYPAFLALFSFLPFPPDLYGSWINIAIGTLTTILAYHIVRTMFGQRAGLLSAASYAFLPQVFAENTLVMSETTYILALFLMASVVMGMLERGCTTARSVALGVCGAAVYYGRPEGMLAFLGCVALVAVTDGRGIGQRLSGTLCSLVVFAVLIAPYVLFLYRQTGLFTLSGKVSTNMANIAGLLQVPASAASSGIIGLYLHDIHATIELIGFNLFMIFWVVMMKQIPVLFIIALAGLWHLRSSRLGMRRSAAFLAALCLPLLSNILFYADIRLLTPFSAVVGMVAGIGIDGAMELPVLRSIRTRLRQAVTASLCIAVFAYGHHVFTKAEATEKHAANNAFETRKLKQPGLWLRQFASPGSVLFGESVGYITAYYADMPFHRLPPGGVKEIVAAMSRHDDAYLWLPQRTAAARPELAILQDPWNPAFHSSFHGKAFELVYRDDFVNLKIYRLRKEFSRRASGGP